ncbi:hypothetical protein SD77_1969 [Bacillus badius]|uniref:Uncharacterized protein n=1 Tax=Bacillus badius TaxID=1455 RepID=A0ABR5AQR0_BACBA|nr:hypothetical protein SD77_1969 [Bacillus badius]
MHPPPDKKENHPIAGLPAAAPYIAAGGSGKLCAHGMVDLLDIVFYW